MADPVVQTPDPVSSHLVYRKDKKLLFDTSCSGMYMSEAPRHLLFYRLKLHARRVAADSSELRNERNKTKMLETTST